MPKTKTITAAELSTGANHCYYVLKECARGKNWPECWPGLEWLANEMKRSSRTVQRHLAELLARGEIQIVRQPGKPNVYRLPDDIKRRPGQPLPTTRGDTYVTPGVTPMSYEGVTPMSPQNVSPNNREATNTASSAEIEISAAAAVEILSEEEMQTTKKSVFDELVALGMPEKLVISPVRGGRPPTRSILPSRISKRRTLREVVVMACYLQARKQNEPSS